MAFDVDAAANVSKDVSESSKEPRTQQTVSTPGRSARASFTPYEVVGLDVRTLLRAVKLLDSTAPDITNAPRHIFDPLSRLSCIENETWSIMFLSILIIWIY